MGTKREEHDDLIGQHIGRYRLVRRLGEGGMGAVYLGEHASIGSRVAVKVLHAEYARRKSIVDRFFAEAQAVNKIRHENIVNVIDLALLPDNRPYLIMEYLEGQPLRELLRPKTGLELGLTLAIAVQVSDALSAAHEHRIVHRDLKPDNVFLVPRRRSAPLVKLLDFGIAKLLDDGDGGNVQTRTGQILGTPRYMSPEQGAGRTGEIDWRSDVYSFGVILFEMVTGRVPFDKNAFGDLLVQHMTQAPPAPRSLRADVPETIESVVLRCLAKLPEDRFQKMDEAGDLLRSELRRIGGVESLPGLDGAVGSVASPTPGPGSQPGTGPASGTRGTITGAGAQLLTTPARTGRRVALAVAAMVVTAALGFAAYATLFGGAAGGDGEYADDDETEDRRPAARKGDDDRGDGPPAKPARVDEAPTGSDVPATATATADEGAPPTTAAKAAATAETAAGTSSTTSRPDKGAGSARADKGKAGGTAHKKAKAGDAKTGDTASKTLDDGTLDPDL